MLRATFVKRIFVPLFTRMTILTTVHSLCVCPSVANMSWQLAICNIQYPKFNNCHHCCKGKKKKKQTAKEKL